MSETVPAAPLLFLARHEELLACPRCGGGLRVREEGIDCLRCEQVFGIWNNIPKLFWPNEWDAKRRDVTDISRRFYEETPFPSYDDLDDVAALIRKARHGVFAEMLDEQIPHHVRILECGCGTGQLSNFLSVANRTVFGTDISLNSLRLGLDFKEANGLEHVCFLQMNLFRPAFKVETFDLVLSMGVLHHTSDPFLGFRSLAALVKPGGYLVVGLYHRYGRLITGLRRLVMKASRFRLKGLDPTLSLLESEWRKKAWLMDQYMNPHETTHTFRQVLKWLEVANLLYVKSIPRFRPFHSISAADRILVPEEPGSLVENFLSELAMIFKGSRDGGLFVVIAKKGC